jgi:hypothetical protein
MAKPRSSRLHLQILHRDRLSVMGVRHETALEKRMEQVAAS